MKLAFLCPSVPGHINPMTALAVAMRARGQTVVFGSIGNPPPALADLGFEFHDLGGDVFPAAEYETYFRTLGTLTGRAALKYTAAALSRASSAMLANGPVVMKRIGADGLVVDQISYSGGSIADRLGLPFVTVCNALHLNGEPGVPPFFKTWGPPDGWWGRTKNRIAWALFEQMIRPGLGPVRAFRREHGLSPSARPKDLWSSRLQVTQCPAEFDFPRRELPTNFHYAGPFHDPAARPPTPFPFEKLDGRPLVYASMGTIQNRIVDVFRTIAEAAADLDVQLVLTTGGGADPDSLGPLPGNPVVVGYAPQLELIRQAKLVVTHAGLNTALEALSAGVPMVAIPVTNDQPGVAARIAWTGAGEWLSPDGLTAARLRPAMERVLTDPTYRSAAGRLREAIARSGRAAGAAETIERALFGRLM